VLSANETFCRRQNHFRHPDDDEIFHFSIGIHSRALFCCRFPAVFPLESQDLRQFPFFLNVSRRKGKKVEWFKDGTKILIAVDIQQEKKFESPLKCEGRIR
jgi:hypothetical protein